MFEPSMQPPFGHQQVFTVPLPVGAVIPYAGPVLDEEAPGPVRPPWPRRKELEMSGWLLCDGGVVPKVRYLLLYQVIGDAYGTPEKDDHFRLPDYRGAFLRGVNGERKPPLDPDAESRTGSGPEESGNKGNAVGSFQQDQSREHDHEIESDTKSIVGGKETPVSVVIKVTSPTKLAKCEGGPTEGFGKETRPVNLYVNFLIKALPDRVTLTVPAAPFGPDPAGL